MAAAGTAGEAVARSGATTLGFTDALRAAAVLEDAVEKLTFLQAVEPDILTHKEELSAAMGNEVERLIERRSQIEERYRALLDERASLQGVAKTKQRVSAIQAEIAEVDRDLKDVTKSLSRALQDNPRVGDNLRKMVGERNQLLELLRGAIAELRSGSGHLGEVEAFVREEQEARQMLEGLKREEDELTRHVEELRKEMHSKRRDHNEKTRALRERMERVKGRVREAKDRTTAVAQADMDKANAATQAHARALALAEARLRARLDKVEAARSVEAGAHAQTAEQLAKQEQELAARLAGAESELKATKDAAVERVEELRERREANRKRLADLLEQWEAETTREREEAEKQRQREIERRRAAADAERRARAAETLRAILPDAFDLVRAFAPPKKKKKRK